MKAEFTTVQEGYEEAGKSAKRVSTFYELPCMDAKGPRVKERFYGKQHDDTTQGGLRARDSISD